MVKIIEPNTCQTCAFSIVVTSGQRFCRRSPPSVAPIYGQGPQGNAVITQWSSSFPPVMDEWACYEHSGNKALSGQAGVHGQH